MNLIIPDRLLSLVLTDWGVVVYRAKVEMAIYADRNTLTFNAAGTGASAPLRPRSSGRCQHLYIVRKQSPSDLIKIETHGVGYICFSARHL